MLAHLFETLRQSVSQLLVNYLSRDKRDYRAFSVHNLDTLTAILQPGDVLLVEGDQRISGAIKYLTQSTWSHSAMYVGDQLPAKHLPHGTPAIIEADLKHGVAAAPLAKYSTYNTRICRAHDLSLEDRTTVVEYMIASLGKTYDLKNIFDLMRYLLPQPPVPRRFRRRMLALGSGDPTRAVCSSLIAQAFQLVRYPVLPTIQQHEPTDRSNAEIMHIRHHSLFAPRDFDLSPYFDVIKPTLSQHFDYRLIRWQEESDDFERTGLIRNKKNTPARAGG